MKNRTWKGAVWCLAAILFLAVAISISGLQGTGGESETQAPPDQTESRQHTGDGNSQAEIHFIDVGQGDATLIKCGEHAMLIDAGENDKGTTLQLYLKKQGIERLDYLILTHPDADHIGGADVIITKFPIGTVFMSDYTKDNKTYQRVIQALADRNLKWTTPDVGASFGLGTAQFTILAPVDSYDDPNNSSIALLFQNGENRFLFTGDAQGEAEQDILEEALSVRAEVYKVGHHGSDTSSGGEFLEAVDPDWAVVSCGVDNSYGHPHAAVLNSLRAMGVKLFRTDEQGSIVALSDGKEITWNCAPSETWQAGERKGSSAQDTRASQGDFAEKDTGTDSDTASAAEYAYIGNTKNGKLHLATCSKLPSEKNRVLFETKEEAVQAGYDDPCQVCGP